MKLEPTVPVAVRELVIKGAGGLTVIARVAEPVPPAFDALIVTEMAPVAIGDPVMAPVTVLTESPAGRPVALNDVGVLLPAIW